LGPDVGLDHILRLCRGGLITHLTQGPAP
jgi:hypothetical protein